MKKLLKLIGKYKIFLAFSVIFAAISVVLQLYVPVLFGDAIDEVVSAHQVNFDMMWYYLKQILILSRTQMLLLLSVRRSFLQSVQSAVLWSHSASGTSYKIWKK